VKPTESDDAQLLLSGIQTTESPLYKIFQDKKADIVKLFPDDKYERFNQNFK
jgi:hypothetical protein